MLLKKPARSAVWVYWNGVLGPTDLSGSSKSTIKSFILDEHYESFQPGSNRREGLQCGNSADIGHLLVLSSVTTTVMAVVTDDKNNGRSCGSHAGQPGVFWMTNVIRKFTSLRKAVFDLCADTFATERAYKLPPRHQRFVGARLTFYLQETSTWGSGDVWQTNINGELEIVVAAYVQAAEKVLVFAFDSLCSGGRRPLKDVRAGCITQRLILPTPPTLYLAASNTPRWIRWGRPNRPQNGQNSGKRSSMHRNGLFSVSEIWESGCAHEDVAD